MAWTDNAEKILKTKYLRPGETSKADVFFRLSNAWTEAGKMLGYFDSEAEANRFRSDVYNDLMEQKAAPNSPQFFNTGVDRPDYYSWADVDGEICYVPNRPQVSACFIQSVDDSIDGIMRLASDEARLFTQGSGTGTNFSSIRHEGAPISKGGSSSGVMSFLKIGDTVAGSIKSGGTTRRAAKMVCMDVDHPDIAKFIAWKPREEAKVAALAVGSHVVSDYLKQVAETGNAPDHIVKRLVPGLVSDALTKPKTWLEPMDVGWQSEAYGTVSGQNSNNTVRVTNKFMNHATHGDVWSSHMLDLMAEAAWRSADPGIHFHDTINEWHTCPDGGEIVASNPCCFAGETKVETDEGLIAIEELARRDAAGERLPKAFAFDFEKGKQAVKPIKKAWKSGYASSLVKVHLSDGQIVRCTPEHIWYLSDYTEVKACDLKTGMSLLTNYCRTTVDNVFWDDLVSSEPVYDIEVEDLHNFSICSTINGVIVHNSEYLFLDDTACNLASINLLATPIDEFEEVVKRWVTVLDISVTLGGYPTKRIAELSQRYRTIGLGFANLGALLMTNGIPYDSEQGRELAADIALKMQVAAAAQSIELAKRLGPFPGFDANSQFVKQVIWGQTDGLVSVPDSGIRNAQLTVIAPTGTIGLLMDCDTTGIEPLYARVAYKELAGGGYMTLAAKCVRDALLSHGYPEDFPGVPGDLKQILASAEEISPQAHLAMMAAVQPHISGAISKTINMPNEATPKDIRKVFEDAWRMGLKCVAVYRNGSKLSAPLSSAPKAQKTIGSSCDELFKTHTELHKKLSAGVDDNSAQDLIVKFYLTLVGIGYQIDEQVKTTHDRFDLAVTAVNYLDMFMRLHADICETFKSFGGDVSRLLPGPAVFAEFQRLITEELPQQGRELAKKLKEKGLPVAGFSRSLPTRRSGYTQKAIVGGHKLFLRTGEFSDGTLAEIFIDMHKEGAAMRSMMNCFAMAVSIGLQHGVPLEEFVEHFTFTKFEPNGMVDGHENIKMATSIIDFMFRDLAVSYLNRTDLAHVQPEGAAPAKPALADTLGFEPDVCPDCFQHMMVRNGTCLLCRNCGATTGCS